MGLTGPLPDPRYLDIFDMHAEGASRLGRRMLFQTIEKLLEGIAKIR